MGRFIRGASLAALLCLQSACNGAPSVECPEGEPSCSGVCTDVTADRTNCGACGTVCTTGELCTLGVCTPSCLPGTSFCPSDGGGQCTSLMSDSANCGGCGSACPAGELCNGAGACAQQCLAPQVLCGSACTSMETDSANCGTCGHACLPGEGCTAGVCHETCASGYSACDGEDGGTPYCADLQRDPDNCSACGAACSLGESCVQGSCTEICGDGLAVCTDTAGSAYCANLPSDNMNCGGCGLVCPQPNVCSAGLCAPTCAGASILCTAGSGSQLCVDPESDSNNCGTCGMACADGSFCAQGSCEPSCVAPSMLCTDTSGSQLCADVQSDDRNCGTCGTACPAGQACVDSACQETCGDGFSACTNDAGSQYCADLLIDSNNCGTCGDVCPAGDACAASMCAPSCGLPLTLCTDTAGSAYCADTRYDPGNCGTCNHACAAGQSCNGSGACIVTSQVCTGSTVFCPSANACVDVENDANNCGSCGNVCPATAQSCSGGLCGACVQPPPGIISWWRAEGNTDDVFGLNDGTAMGPVTYAPGEVGQAFAFNGSSTVQAMTNGFPFGGGDRTLEFWVNIASIDSTTGQSNTSVFNYGSMSSNDFFGIGFYTSLASFVTQWGTGTGGPTATANVWTHFAATSASSTLTLYVNGASVGSNGVPVSTTTAGATVLGNGLVGLLDEAAIYSRALSASEIASIYQAGTGGKCVPTPTASSCNDILTAGNSTGDGLYWINPDGYPVQVFCDMTTAGGGWTVFYAGENGEPSDFAQFESTPIDCPDPGSQCLRWLPQSAPSTVTIAAQCGSAILTFNPSAAALAYLQEGTQSGWQPLSNVTAVAGGATVSDAANLWTGSPGDNGWILSSSTSNPTIAGTFADSYDFNSTTQWDACNGVANEGAPVRLMYR